MTKNTQSSDAPEPKTSLFLFLLEIVAALVCESALAGLSSHESFIPKAARVLTLIAFFTVVRRFAWRGLKRLRLDSIRNGTVFYLIFILSIIVIATSKILSIGLAVYLENNEFTKREILSSLYFGLPFATGALLTRVVLGARAALIHAIFISATIAFYTPGNQLIFPLILSECLIGALSLSRVRSRSAFLTAGLQVTCITLVFVLISLFLESTISTPEVAARLAGAIVGGLLSSVIAAGLIPVIEYIGGYATDMRLIEMATLDHPLLKELSIQAPGTWNHSMVMGMMVESGAEVIGANSVICRVGAYFHDIGKMKKPLYFAENQPAGENRHDKLSPSMSALIIRSHVKDGIELAKKYKIPPIIEDMIPQHHGTSLIEYFYEKSRSEAESNGEDPDSIDPTLYRYPGPKPQTKEAGLLMLADGIEAAARTLTDPSQDRIQGMVQKMINKVFSSGELNECELTLRDLHKIAKCFTRVLAGIYHQRVAYAEPAEKVNEDSHVDEDNMEVKKEEDLKRLGSEG